MGVVRSAFLASAVLAAPTAVLTPPLQSGTSPGQVAYEVKVLSQLATTGHYLYHQHCRNCHGERAAGGAEAPSLLERRFWQDNYNRQTFHHAVQELVPDHRVEGHGLSPAKLSFNDIEIIGRYLREVQQPDLYR